MEPLTIYDKHEGNNRHACWGVEEKGTGAFKRVRTLHCMPLDAFFFSLARSEGRVLSSRTRKTGRYPSGGQLGRLRLVTYLVKTLQTSDDTVKPSITDFAYRGLNVFKH